VLDDRWTRAADNATLRRFLQNTFANMALAHEFVAECGRNHSAFNAATLNRGRALDASADS